MPVIVLIADGARPDFFASALDRGELPALARLRAEGGLYTVSSCFPSVTGPAYLPFLTGQYPGPAGLPGLRWYDRSRRACAFPDFTRSYVGWQMSAVDRDLDPLVPTIFELCADSLGALSVIGRGLPPGARIGALTPRNLGAVLRAARTHFTGNVRGWLAIDDEVGAAVATRIREQRPRFVFAALTGVDKTSHAAGHEAPVVRDALRIVDETAARIRADAERLGYWADTHLWITSDHGHSRVRAHDDLALAVAELGHRVIAHPWVYAVAPDVAVMVSGNAMAHVYLALERRDRPYWPALGGDPRWRALLDALVARPSVDLALLPQRPDPRDGGATRVEVRTRDRGRAMLREHVGADGVRRFDYERTDGDPLGVGADLRGADADEAYEATIATDYPDGVVQICRLAGAPRSGEIILSAARDWDFRARFEPIPHVSAHGALHREHMLVPLLLNRAPRRTPRRTVDVFPSALTALGLEVPAAVEGESWW